MVQISIKIRLTLFILFSATSVTVWGQRYTLSESEISFFSEAPLENIEALNTETSGLFDPSTGKLALAVPIKSFNFEHSLMQEHFNEKYMESDKYPRAFYQGELQGWSSDRVIQNLSAKGKLTIHGVEKEYTVNGVVTKKEGSYSMKGEFAIMVKDHKVKIPKLMWQNIADEILVTVNLVFNEEN